MLAPIPTPDGFWPITGAGWLSLGSILVGAGVMVFGWGKWTQRVESLKDDFTAELNNHKDQVKSQLDGVGGRVGGMEAESEHLSGRLEQASTQIQRLLGQHDSILAIIGEARGSMIQCREDTQALAEKIDRRLETITTKMSGVELNLSERLRAVETKLDIVVQERNR